MRAPPTRGDGGVAAPPIAHHEVPGQKTYIGQRSRGGEDAHPPLSQDAFVAEAERLATIWPGAVIPLAGIVEVRGSRVCACPDGTACKPERAGKHPLGLWRGLTADEITDEIERIVRETGALPNIGLLTGSVSGVCVIDVDLYCDDPLDELEATTGISLMSPLMATTGRGGRHLLFRDGGWQSGTKVVPGVDIRAAGGLVVLPPSRAAHGDYAWVSGPPTPELVAALPTVPSELAVHMTTAAERPRAHGKAASAVRGVPVPAEGDAGAAIARWPWLAQALIEPPVDGMGGQRPGRHQQVYRFVARCDQAGIPAEIIVRLLGSYAPAVDKGQPWLRSDAPRVVAKVVARRALRPGPTRAAAPAPDLPATVAALRTLAGTYADSRAPLLSALCVMAQRTGSLQVTTSTRALATAAALRRDTVAPTLARLSDEGAADVAASPSGLAIRLRHPLHTHCVSGPDRADCHSVLQPDHPIWYPRAAGQHGRRVVEALLAGARTAAEVRSRIGRTPRRALARLVDLGLVRRWGPRPYYRLAPDFDPTDPSYLDAALERVEKLLADRGEPTIAMSRERAVARHEADRARDTERRAAWLAERRAAWNAERRAADARGQDVEPPWEPDDGLQQQLEAAASAEVLDAEPDPDDAPPGRTLEVRPVSAGQVARGLPAALVTRYGAGVGGYVAAGHPLGPRTVQLFDARRERIRFGVDTPSPEETAAGLGPTADAVEAWRRWRAPQTIDAASVWWIDDAGHHHRVTTVSVVITRGRRPTMVTADGQVLRPRGRLDVTWGFRPRTPPSASVPMYTSERSAP